MLGRGSETRPLIYLFSPLLFQALAKKAKEECKKGEKGYHESTSRYKRREELVGGRDHEVTHGTAGGWRRGERGGRKGEREKDVSETVSHPRI